MQNTKQYSEAKIYIPERSRGYSEDVEHISLTKEEAKAQGWHFRYKSKNRLRITRYTGTAEDIIIPAEIGGCIVNDIGAKAFHKTNIRTVSVPDTVKKLGAECFSWCMKLEEAVFADGVEHIPFGAFLDCKSLTHVHLPYKTLRSLGERAFYFCEKLEFIDLPFLCHTVGKDAFTWTRLKAFAMTRCDAYYLHFDGSALDATPLMRENDLILFQPYNCLSNEIYILKTGRNIEEKYIRLPKNSRVKFLTHSITHSCRLDLTDCKEINIDLGCFEDKLVYNSVFLIFPKDKMPVTLPTYLESNFFDEVAYHMSDHQVTSQVVARESVMLLKGSVDALSLRAIRFKEVTAAETASAEVFTKNCRCLHGVIWEEGGREFRKLTTPSELLTDWYGSSVNEEMLKAFTIRKDPDTGESIFYDRGVIDRLFRGELQGKAKILPNKHDKVFIAVDMLRSTPKPGEDSTEMYSRFLLKNKRHADIAMSKLPERWREYKDFLDEFYRLNK